MYTYMIPLILISDYDSDFYLHANEFIHYVLRFAVSLIPYDIIPVMNSALKIFSLKPSYVFFSSTENDEMEKVWIKKI